MLSIYSLENPVSFESFSTKSLSYNFITSLSATRLPIYLPPDPDSLDIVIITFLFYVFLVFVSVIDKLFISGFLFKILIS